MYQSQPDMHEGTNLHRCGSKPSLKLSQVSFENNSDEALNNDRRIAAEHIVGYCNLMIEKIPRRIIQTQKSKDVPLLAKAGIANLSLLNPDFEYLFFDDAQVEEFIDAQFPQYRPIFDSFAVRIQRYDFFRYLAVYRFGGFYFDTDVLLASGREDLLEFGCVFPFET